MKELLYTFQHAISGMIIAAHYNQKKLVLEMVDSLEDLRPYIKNDEVYITIEKLCKEHKNKHFETISDVISYLRKHGIYKEVMLRTSFLEAYLCTKKRSLLIK